ncbi:hypothetical protein ACRDNQ_09335 [Palleronia sp. KMU-117]|uniref:hypothetical protein n=1 Tax=Palleronia sp. KMU-117 TaxID=3434108 RepID=UPI003D7256E7
MTDGAIYVATGQDYLDLARASAATLRHHNPGLPVDVFTDCPDAPGLEVFDAVHTVARVHPRAKIDCMPLSRFDRTLYLDCDTLILAPFGDLFDLMQRFDLALAHDMRRASDLVQEGHAERTPYAFPQLNSGVVLYRNSPAMARFFADWAARYRAAGATRDQVALKDLLWASDLRFYVLPTEFNLRRVTLLDAWEPLDARPTILHSHRLLDHLRRLGVPRVRSLGEVVTLERAALAAEWATLGLDEDGRRDTERLLALLGMPPVRETRPARLRKAAV